jgi:hypothetical protein
MRLSTQPRSDNAKTAAFSDCALSMLHVCVCVCVCVYAKGIRGDQQTQYLLLYKLYESVSNLSVSNRPLLDHGGHVGHVTNKTVTLL